ncbi:MAG: hypothetical protein KJ077_07455 [Anaerolineae bacterium]|nr:hypothetical protein [Anaerolineae bacterium]
MPNKGSTSPLPQERSEVHLSRRQFVQGLSALFAGGLLAGCGLSQEQMQQEVARWGTPTPARVLASPQPSPPEIVTTSQEGELSLDQFMVLSMVLTGFTGLNPILGQVYRQSLQNAETKVTLAELYEQAGFQGPALPQGLDQRIFEQESTRALADKIIEYWYTGIYEENGEQVVATTTEALAWQALNFTKPLTVCGPRPGFWAERPNAGPMPRVHQVSLSQEEASSAN